MKLNNGSKSENAEHSADATKAQRNQSTEFNKSSVMEVSCFHRVVLQENRRASGGWMRGLNCREVGTNARLDMFSMIASKLIMLHYENIMAAGFPPGRHHLRENERAKDDNTWRKRVGCPHEAPLRLRFRANSHE